MLAVFSFFSRCLDMFGSPSKEFRKGSARKPGVEGVRHAAGQKWVPKMEPW